MRSIASALGRVDLRCFVDVGFVKQGSKIDRKRLLEWWAMIGDPSLGAEPFTFTSDVAAEVISRNFDMLGEWGHVVWRVGLNEASRDWTFLTRIQVGLHSVLGTLRATANWRTIHDELRTGAARPGSMTVGLRQSRSRIFELSQVSGGPAGSRRITTCVE